MWVENGPAVELFILCGTQWKHHQGGTPKGLDYAAVDLVARVYKFTLDAEMFGKIQVLEREFIKVRCPSGD